MQNSTFQWLKNHLSFTWKRIKPITWWVNVDLNDVFCLVYYRFSMAFDGFVCHKKIALMLLVTNLLSSVVRLTQRKFVYKLTQLIRELTHVKNCIEFGCFFFFWEKSNKSIQIFEGNFKPDTV